jgi:hypothetical protein
MEALRRRRLDHPNIVKFLGVFREGNDGCGRLAFVFVKIEGQLLDFLQSTHYNPRVDRKRIVGDPQKSFKTADLWLLSVD